MVGASNFLLLVCLSWLDLPVSFLRLQGNGAETGRWESLDSEQFKVRVDGKVESIPLNRLQSIEITTTGGQEASELRLPSGLRGDGVAQAGSAIQVLLQDGSALGPRKLVSDGKLLNVELSDEVSLSLAPERIRSVQLQSLNEKQLLQWRAIQESRLGGDILVVIRSAEAIDKIEGQILDVGEQRVLFEYNGQRIEAPRSKLAGIRFLAPPTEISRTLAVVDDVFGNRYQVSQFLVVQPDLLSFVTACNASITLPLSIVAKLDFSSGSVKYLADLNALALESQPALVSKTAVSGSEQLFAAQAVGLPKSNGKALRMLGNSSITFRVPGEYQTVAGRVYLAPDGDQFSACQVSVLLENQVVWQGELNHPRERLEVKAKVEPEQRLQMTVRSLSPRPTGNVVIWEDIRLLK